MRFTTQLIAFGLAVLCLPIIGFGQKKKAKNLHSFFDLEYAKVGGVLSWRVLAKWLEENLSCRLADEPRLRGSQRGLPAKRAGKVSRTRA